MFTLQTVGFVLNVGQQNPSYVKGRQAGRCRERAAGGCAAVAMEEAVAHISLPQHRWRWTGRDADRERERVPTMKTVLSLHRKWAHAVKTIRILQGLVSAILQSWLRFDLWLGQLDPAGAVGDLSACFFFLFRPSWFSLFFFFYWFLLQSCIEFCCEMRNLEATVIITLKSILEVKINKGFFRG